MEEYAFPQKTVFDDFSLITRETSRAGDRVAKQELLNIVRGSRNNLLFCGQFLPDGDLLKSMIDAAGRDVEVSIISNGLSFHRQPMYIVNHLLAERKLKV